MVSRLVILASITSVVVLAFIVWMVILIVKKRRALKKLESGNYEEVSKDFEYAEKRMRESEGEENPQEILWDIANSKRTERGINNGNKDSTATVRRESGIFNARESGTPKAKLPSLPERPSKFSSYDTSGASGNQDSNTGVKRNNNRGLFRRK